MRPRPPPLRGQTAGATSHPTGKHTHIPNQAALPSRAAEKEPAYAFIPRTSRFAGHRRSGARSVWNRHDSRHRPNRRRHRHSSARNFNHTRNYGPADRNSYNAEQFNSDAAKPGYGHQSRPDKSSNRNHYYSRESQRRSRNHSGIPVGNRNSGSGHRYPASGNHRKRHSCS